MLFVHASLDNNALNRHLLSNPTAYGDLCQFITESA